MRRLPVHLVLKPCRGDVGATAERGQYAGAFGEQVQAGVDDIAHAAVQLVRVERDLLDLGGVHPGDGCLPRCGAALVRSRTPPTARPAGPPTARYACWRPGAAPPGTTRSACRTGRASSCSRPCARSPPRRRRPGPDSPAPQWRWPLGATVPHRRLSRRRPATSSKRTRERRLAAHHRHAARCVIPGVVVSTATMPVVGARDDHVGAIRVGDEVRDTAHPPPVAVALAPEETASRRCVARADQAPSSRGLSPDVSRGSQPDPTPSQSMASAAYTVL